MATRTLCIRWLSGHLGHIGVAPETPVSELRAQLQQDLPDFHKMDFFVGGSLLVREGTIEEAGLASGSEVQVVATVDVDEVIKTLHSSITEAFHGGRLLRTNFEKRIRSAVRLLDQMEGLSGEHCPMLFDMITLAPFRLISDDLYEIDISGTHCCVRLEAAAPIAAAKAFSRGCGNPAQRLGCEKRGVL
jgi:hypothetical protein